MEQEVIEAELVLPVHLSFKKVQMYEKFPKGQSRGRHWKHLKQIIQAENYQNYPAEEPNYVNIESPPSMHPNKKICDITGYEMSSSHSRFYELHRTFSSMVRTKQTCRKTCTSEGQMRARELRDKAKEAPYLDPRTKLRYANTEVFRQIRSLPNEYVQSYLALRNAAVVLR